MSTYVYAAAVLIAADRNDKRAWIDHNTRLGDSCLVLVPAAVVAQVSRSARQVQLRRFLAGCTIVPFTERDAHEAGRLLGLTKTADVVDAAVVGLAASYAPAAILTSDTFDIHRLVAAASSAVRVLAV